MAIRPALRTAVAGNKIKASEYNDNFTDMLNYLDDVVDDMEDYVGDYMPTQSGQDGKFLSTNGTAASWTDIMPTLAGLPSSDYINGLVITKNTSSPNDTIDVSAGSCFDSTKAKILNLGSAKTKQNSSQAISTTYYVYLIAKSDLSAYDILITTSSSSPTLPTDYVYYRQIGNYTTDGSGYIADISNYSNNASTSFMPDYANAVSIASSAFPYTVLKNGFVSLGVSSDVGQTGGSGSRNFYINGTNVKVMYCGNAGLIDEALYPVVAGDIISTSGTGTSGTPKGTFYGVKGV